MDLQAQLEELKSSTQAKLAEMRGNNAKELQELRVQVLGKKGSLTELLKGLKDLSKEMRPVVGKQVNEVRDVLTKAFEEQAKSVEAAKIKAQLESESLDEYAGKLFVRKNESNQQFLLHMHRHTHDIPPHLQKN